MLIIQNIFMSIYFNKVDKQLRFASRLIYLPLLIKKDQKWYAHVFVAEVCTIEMSLNVYRNTILSFVFWIFSVWLWLGHFILSSFLTMSVSLSLYFLMDWRICYTAILMNYLFSLWVAWLFLYEVSYHLLKPVSPQKVLH